MPSSSSSEGTCLEAAAPPSDSSSANDGSGSEIDGPEVPAPGSDRNVRGGFFTDLAADFFLGGWVDKTDSSSTRDGFAFGISFFLGTVGALDFCFLGSETLFKAGLNINKVSGGAVR